MIFRDQDTIWETGPWYRYYILGFLLRSLNISHEWFKNLRGYLASLANKLPKPCQVLIYLTFAAERNCQKFKRVHFKHQTSFHHLYSGLRPNFYSWVKQWQVCMSRLKARCPVSRPDQWCPDCCPVPGRHQISPANKLGSGGQWWAVAAMLGDMRLYLRQLPDSCGWWRPYRGAERAIDFGCNLELVLESWERASHYFNCSNFVISPLIETYQLQPGTRQLQLHFLSPWSWWKLPLCSSPAPSTLTLHLFSVVSCNCLAEIRRQKEG